MSKEASFKYTFPVIKAEERADGLYLVGEATGPEIDSQNERMAPSAIEAFTSQIDDAVRAGSPVPFTEIHQTDGVFSELGSVVKGWLTPDFHLGVEVKLEDENPAAEWLYKSVKNKGKKVGMSIFGNVPEGSYKDEMILGKSVRTFFQVNLESIGRTTRPIWYPSLGTVLAKAVDEAAEGDNAVAKIAETPKDEAAQPEESKVATAKGPTPAGSPEENDTTTAVQPGPGISDKEKQADEHARLLASEAAAPTGLTNKEIAEKAEKAGISKDKVAKVVQLYGLLDELGLIDKTEQDASAATPATAEKSQSGNEDIGEVVRKAVEAATTDLRAQLGATQTQLERVLDNTPEGTAPGAVSKHEMDEAEKAQWKADFDKMSPADRLLVALAAKHGK